MFSMLYIEKDTQVKTFHGLCLIFTQILDKVSQQVIFAN